MRPALPVLQQLIHLNDEEVLTDACWALSYLSDGTNDKIQAVIEAGVCPRLVELLLYAPIPTEGFEFCFSFSLFAYPYYILFQINSHLCESNAFRCIYLMLLTAFFS